MAGIYIHIPFCASRCAYCDFYSTTSFALRDGFVDALMAEMEAQHGFPGSETPRTVYFGGGTPSTLSTGQLGRIWEALGGLWDLSALKEATLEANPDDLASGYLEGLAVLPFDRLSIGVQSFDDGILRMMNRRHTAARAVQAVEDAQRAGFSRLSIDLIYGVPGMTMRQWEDSLQKAVDLGAEHISAYHLTIESGTPFGRQGLAPVAEEVGEEQYTMLCNTLRAAGYEHYEISNFALPGRRAQHNSAYWRGEPYLGLGPAAHSYDGRRMRRWNGQSLGEYLKGVEHRSENLSDTDLYNEYVMTSLRTSEGADATRIEARFGEARRRDFEAGAAHFLRTGVMGCEDGRFFVKESKMLVSDDVIASLFV